MGGLLGFAARGWLNDCRGADAMRTTDAKQRKGQRASRLPCLPRREIGHGGLPTAGLFGDLRLRHPLIGDRFDEFFPLHDPRRISVNRCFGKRFSAIGFP